MTPSLGLDMSQAVFRAALLLANNRFVEADFCNDARGFHKLGLWLRQHFAGKARVAVESTNVFAEAVLLWLYEHGYEVFLLNPERVAYYARSLGQRNKTDPADARTIAHFIAKHEATPWRPPTPQQRDLRHLMRTRSQLQKTSISLRSQRKTAGSIARPYLDSMIEAACAQLKKIEKDIVAHLKRHPELWSAVQLLRSVKSTGLITAATMIAELPPITPQTDPRAICAWAGLTPHRHQSAKTEWRTRISRRGNAYVRDALYMPALVAKRYNPLLRDFAARLKANGKSTRAILGAIAHKMLRIYVGLLKSGTPFDPNWSFQKT